MSEAKPIPQVDFGDIAVDGSAAPSCLIIQRGAGGRLSVFLDDGRRLAGVISIRIASGRERLSNVTIDLNGAQVKFREAREDAP